MYLSITFTDYNKITMNIIRFTCNGIEIQDKDVMFNCFIDGDNYIKIKGSMFDIEFYVKNVMGFTI